MALAGVAGAESFDWRPEGPEGGPILELEFHPEDPESVFVLTRGGEVYRSADRGDHWARAEMRGHLPPDPQFLSSYLSPQGGLSLFSGGHTDGVFVSRDAGDSWQLISPSTLGEVFVDVAVDHSDPLRMIAAQGRQGVARSLDGGQSWHPVGLGVVDPNDEFYQRVFQHPSLEDRWFVLTFSGHALGSEDGGDSWAELDGARFAKEIAFDPGRPTDVYALQHQGLFRSTDSGTTWEQISVLSAVVDGGLTVVPGLSPSSPARVCVTLRGSLEPGSVECSEDLGATWETVGGELPAGFFNGLYADADGSLFVATALDELYRLDLGEWQALERGLHATVVSDFLAGPADSAGLFAAVGGSLQRRAEDGAWTKVPDTGLGSSTLVSMAATSDLDYPLVGAALHRLVRGDGESGWETVDGTAGSTLWKVVSVGGDLLFAGGDFVLYRSLDGGATWIELDTAGVAVQRIRTILVTGDPPSQVFVGMESGSVLIRSDDLGATWTHSNGELYCSVVYALAADPRDSSRLYAGSYCGFHRSEDGGVTWQKVGRGLANDVRVFDLKVDPVTPDTLYAVVLGSGDGNRSHGRGIWVSDDRGDHWRLLGLPGNGQGTTLEWVSGGRLWVGTQGSSAYSMALPGIFADGFESGDLSAWSVP